MKKDKPQKARETSAEAEDNSLRLGPDRLAKGETGFAKGVACLREQLKTMPTAPGVYRMLAADGGVLYVGKAKNLKNRVTSYTQQARLPLRLQRMVAQVRGVEIVVTRTEAEALLLEANLIQRFMPPFNVLLRDDKSYPYILLTRDHDFPQMLKHRGRQTRKGWYFGPFASVAAVTETLEQLQRGFMLRICSDQIFATRSRPCLQYHIKRCTAPCVGRVSCEAYGKQVADACAFLRGESSDIQKKLADEMQKASEAMAYETAAQLRDRIKSLTQIQAQQDVFVAGLGDADVIALHRAGDRLAVQMFFYRADRNYGSRTHLPTAGRGAGSGEVMAAFLGQFYADKDPPPLILLSDEPEESALIAEALSARAGHKIILAVPRQGDKKRLVDAAMENARTFLARKMEEGAEQTRLLRRVADIFGLSAPPARIEVYDNSHLSGKFAVGGMIAAGPEGFLRKTYRKFTIKDPENLNKGGGDDFGMMREVLTRRFARLKAEDPGRQSGMWPDLLLIDGGAGQIGKVVQVLADLDVADVPVVGIAKGPDRNAGRERFFLPGREAFSLPMDDPALYYLQRLRDEAHRFAIGTHRAKRAKAIEESGLEGIGGIGPARKKALLHHFGSAKAVQGASIEDLMRVRGINRDVAKKIHDSFR